MMLAESQFTPPGGIAGWLACLAFVLWIANLVWKLTDRAKGKPTNQIISPQPFVVEVAKQLHEQFASKTEFEAHKAHTTQRHAQMFASIERVEKDARRAMDERFKELNEERRQTLDKLNTEFVFIRENLAAINRELEIRNEK